MNHNNLNENLLKKEFDDVDNYFNFPNCSEEEERQQLLSILDSSDPFSPNSTIAINEGDDSSFRTYASSMQQQLPPGLSHFADMMSKMASIQIADPITADHNGNRQNDSSIQPKTSSKATSSNCSNIPLGIPSSFQSAFNFDQNIYDYRFLNKNFQTLLENPDFIDLALWDNNINSTNQNKSMMKSQLYQFIIRQLLNDGFGSVAVALQQKIDPAIPTMNFSADDTLYKLFSIFYYIETRSKIDPNFENIFNWVIRANNANNNSSNNPQSPTWDSSKQLATIYGNESTDHNQNQISFDTLPATVSSVPTSTGYAPPLQVAYKFGQIGSGPGCLDTPHGFCLGIDNDIVIADTNNHRICVFSLQGTFKFSFGEYGTQIGKLHQPRKIAMLPPSVIAEDNNPPIFIVCDRGNKRSRMQVFSTTGNFIREIQIPSMDIVSGLTTTQDRKIALVDSVRSGVVVMDEFGTIINWFSCAAIMLEPSDIALHNKRFFICDFKGHNICVFDSHGIFCHRLEAKMLKFPNGIDISDYGDIICGDSHGNRFHISVFHENGKLVNDYDCPFLKVSRCCGLRLTKEGLIVTLAKNNNHVVVMNSITIG